MVVALSPPQAAGVAVGLLAAGTALRAAPAPRVRATGLWFREGAIVAALYGLWQLAGRFSLHDTDGAYHRAAVLHRWERDVGLPDEADLQAPLLHHPLLGHAATLYYDSMHFTLMGVFLVWLFWRHRDRYPTVRTWLAITTAACLVVQLVPVAPPRFLPGFADVAQHFDLSVYSGGLAVDQLSAMPSVHVAWAVLIGASVVWASPSRWRWAGLLHPLITVYVVVATGNHWWADGIVAVALLFLAAVLQWAVHRWLIALQRHVATLRAGDGVVPSPAGAAFSSAGSSPRSSDAP